MTDIVAETRDLDSSAYPSPAHYAAYLEGLSQALADEIEGLRQDRDRLAGSLAVCGVIAREGDGTCLPDYETDSVIAVRQLRAEVERLRKELKASGKWAQRNAHINEMMAQKITDKNAEIERLRELVDAIERRDDVEQRVREALGDKS